MTIITEIEEAEFKLVDALSRLGQLPIEKTGELRRQCEEVLAKVRAKKRQLLALAPDVLRKASAHGRSTPEPRWVGLPSIEPEVAEMIKAARDRQS
jgi:hypothetical protein